LAAQPLLAFEIALEWITALNPNAERGVLIETAAMVVVNDQPPAATPTEPVCAPRSADSPAHIHESANRR
jgi:hypothetical protein